MSEEPEPVAYGLVMPFVVCESKGGPYDDEAFVCGWEAASIDALLAAGPDEVERTVHAGLLPQLDLIAMEHGYMLASQPWDEAPDEWAFARFVKVAEVSE